MTARLSRNRLLVYIPETLAKKLDGNAEYKIYFSATEDRLKEIDKSLTAIFSGIGIYEREF